MQWVGIWRTKTQLKALIKLSHDGFHRIIRLRESELSQPQFQISKPEISSVSFSYVVLCNLSYK